MASAETTVVLVRHGETDWSRERRHTGRTDVPLTEEGRRAAAALPRVLDHWSFVDVLTSPLRRAAETCELAGWSGRARSCPDLREWDYGAYEGRTTPDIRRDQPDWSIWTHPVPGGESLEEVAARADRVLEAVIPLGGPVLLFGHGHALRVLAARWCGLPAVEGRVLPLDAAATSVLGHEHGRRVIRHWNRSA